MIDPIEYPDAYRYFKEHPDQTLEQAVDILWKKYKENRSGA